MSAVALLAICCGRSDVSSPAGPPAVTLTRAEFDAAYLVWGAPTGEVSSYDVELRVVPGSFRLKERLDGHYIGYAVDLRDEPELSELEIRLVANPGARASNVVSVRHGVRAPAVGWSQATPNEVVVTVLDASLVADRVLLERQAVYWDGTGATWSVLPLQPGASEYVDSDLSQWTDGARLYYCATAFAGTEASAKACTVGTLPATLAAPVLRSTAVVDGAVHLVIENRSLHTPEIQVYRQAWWASEMALVDVVPAPATGATAEFVDADVPPGSYRYFLRGWDRRGDPTFSWRWSDLVPTWIVVPPATSTGLSAVLRTVPPGVLAAREPSGAFVTVANVLYESISPGLVADADSLIVEGDAVSGTLRLPDATGLFYTTPIGDGSLSRPGVAVDGAGTPHSVYAALPGPWDELTDVPLVHAWHDGQAWQTEEIARRKTDRVWFDLGLDGILRASWFVPIVGLGPGGRMEVATRRDGAWTIEDVSAALGDAYHPYWSRQLLVGDENGFPHVFVSQEDAAPSHVFQDGSGWHVEEVPYQPDLGGVYTYETRFAVASGGCVSVALTVYDWANRTYFVEVVDRAAAGWRLPERLAGGQDLVAVAGSHDGARSAFVLRDGNGVRLWMREAGSSVDRGWLDAGRPIGVGFDPSGKAWLLSWLVTDPQPFGTTVPAALFEEL